MDQKKIIITGAKVFIICGVFVVFIYWFINIYPSFMHQRHVRKQFTLFIKEAKTLKINYDNPVESIEKFKNKHAIWCIQNIGENEVYYMGDLKKRLLVSNYYAMPKFAGGKHSQCTDMLVKIENAKVTSSGSMIVNVQFIYGFQ